MGLRSACAGLILFLAAAAGAQVSKFAGDTATSPPAGKKNAPFSAVVITQYDRALDNGGHIHRETRGKIFRDSQGRTRTESEMPAPQLGADKYQHITINDPVQQVVINLNVKYKTATIYHFGEGIGPTAPIGSQNAAASSPRPGTSTARSGSTIQVGPGAGPGVAPDPQIAAGALNGPSPDHRTPAKGTTTSKLGANIYTSGIDTKTVSLGNRTIEGVMATGTQTTRTLDAELMGTDKPVVSVNEIWYSPELGTRVLTETDDGQSGHSTMKLVNIVRSEPDPQLFQVPPEYQVKESVPAASARR